MKSTVYFEPVNGYLVRLYSAPTDSTEHHKYDGVVIIEVEEGGEVAVAKGAMGKLTKYNVTDIETILRELGVKKWYWERFDKLGNLRHTSLHLL